MIAKQLFAVVLVSLGTSQFLTMIPLIPVTACAAEPLPAYEISTVMGTGNAANNGDAGPALEMNIGDPFGVEIGPDGGLYVTEVRHHRLWRIDRELGTAQVIAGTGEAGYRGDGGPARQAQLNEPYEVRFARDGTIYVVEMKNHIVRRIQAGTGLIDTVAGTGVAGFGGDGGPATQAQLREPHSIALWREAELLIADLGNHRIRHVDLSTGKISSWAGADARRLPSPGQTALGTPVLGPRALFVEPGAAEIWVALREGHSIWQLSGQPLTWHPVAGDGVAGYQDVPADTRSTGGTPPSGKTSNTPAGTSATEPLSSPVSAAAALLQSRWNGPKGICADADGTLFVVDTENQAIRRIDRRNQRVETVAGDGTQRKGYAGDGGPARQAQLARPHGICVAADGTIYVGDTENHRVRALRPLPAAR